MRNKARKICTRNPLPFGNIGQENEKDSLEPDREIEIKQTWKNLKLLVVRMI